MGMGPKVSGNQFEALFHRAAIRQSIGILRIPDGCRRVGLKKLIPVKTPADFVLVHNSKCAFIDTKTQGSGSTFPLANINMNQVHAMASMVQHGAIGGYVVWFRNINEVVFFDCEILKNAEEGIHCTRGFPLGSIEEMNLVKLMVHGNDGTCEDPSKSSDDKIGPRG